MSDHNNSAKEKFLFEVPEVSIRTGARIGPGDAWPLAETALCWSTLVVEQDVFGCKVYQGMGKQVEATCYK